MPTGKSKGQSNAKSQGYKFINYRLSAQDERNLEAMDVAVEFPLTLALDLVAEGFKLSINSDPKNHSYVASLSDTNPSSAFYQHILTGRGSTPIDAWIALAYRHYVAAEQDWSNICVVDGSDSRRFW